MTLTGSYVDVSEAETYFDGDPRAEDFLDEDMEWYLIRATKTIDALPLQGTKYLQDGTQPLQFPREYEGGYYDADETTGEAEVPQAVLDACCEEALAIYLQGTSGGRRQLQEEGVASYTIGGKLQETFTPGAATRLGGLRSADAHRLLKTYIARSVPII